MTKIILAFLFTFVSCSTDKGQAVNNSRVVSSVGFELNDSEYSLNQCFSNSKIDCYSQYPYDGAKRWLESDSDYNKRLSDTYDAFKYCLTTQSVACAKDNGEDQLADIIIENQESLKNEMYAANLRKNF